MGRRLFISYSRRDRDAVEQLVRNLEAGGHDVWIDRRIPGGSDWWDSILDQIEGREVFVAALSAESVKSEACNAEVRFAQSLRKVIFPISIGPSLDTNALPEEVAPLQIVPYHQPTTEMAIALTRLIDGLPPAGPPPDQKPTRPPVPISYLVALRERLRSAEQFSEDDQIRIVMALKSSLRKPEERASAIDLLQLMRSRPGLFAVSAGEIDEAVAQAAREDAASRLEPPPGFAAPAPQPPRRRSGKRAAIAAGVVVVLAGAATGGYLLANRDDGGGTTPTTLDLRSSTTPRVTDHGATLPQDTTGPAPTDDGTVPDVTPPAGTTARTAELSRQQLDETQLVPADDPTVQLAAGSSVLLSCTDTPALISAKLASTGSIAQQGAAVFASQAAVFDSVADAGQFMQVIASIPACTYNHADGSIEQVLVVTPINLGVPNASAVKVHYQVAVNGLVVEGEDDYVAVGRYVGVASCTPVQSPICSRLANVFITRLQAVAGKYG